MTNSYWFLFVCCYIKYNNDNLFFNVWFKSRIITDKEIRSNLLYRRTFPVRLYRCFTLSNLIDYWLSLVNTFSYFYTNIHFFFIQISLCVHWCIKIDLLTTKRVATDASYIFVYEKKMYKSPNKDFSSDISFWFCFCHNYYLKFFSDRILKLNNLFIMFSYIKLKKIFNSCCLVNRWFDYINRKTPWICCKIYNSFIFSQLVK